ncbi:hypothetical protein GCM10009821_21230 [Aeromicrobium halocynthiae]|uniref:Stress-response A/B barrel domain-containing protein n=1 Tax=Aeromicrobium halocynthiae TaxID=560557 RepID=A0ABN2W3R4_9ACTN
MSETPGYRHIVLFRVHDDVPGATVDHALDVLTRLCTLPGATHADVTLSEDRRKGRVIVQNVRFADRDALETFRAHPRHGEAGALMRTIADWWVGDYPEPSGTVTAPDLTK